MEVQSTQNVSNWEEYDSQIYVLDGSGSHGVVDLKMMRLTYQGTTRRLLQ